MGTIWQQPSPSDYDRWVALLIQGDEPSQAAKAIGFTCSAFRRTDPDKHTAALEISREARASFADERAELWANEPDADYRMRELWLARWNSGYRKSSAVEVTGELGVQVDITAALERLNTMVAAAAVRHAATRGADLDAGSDDGAGTGPARLAVGPVVRAA